MLEQLIEKTNAAQFYHRGRIHLTELKGQIGYVKTMEFNFVVEERDDYGKLTDVEYWRLIAHNTIKYSGLFVELYMPYVKLKVMDEHPLLWPFTKNELICELHGFPDNPSEFIGDLFFAFEQKAGNWIALHEHFFNIKQYYLENGKKNLRIPEPVVEPVRQVCEKHRIEFNIESVIKDSDKGRKHWSNAKLLIFGNEVVSPNNFNLRQPYIIAEEFMASKK